MAATAFTNILRRTRDACESGARTALNTVVYLNQCFSSVSQNWPSFIAIIISLILALRANQIAFQALSVSKSALIQIDVVELVEESDRLKQQSQQYLNTLFGYQADVLAIWQVNHYTEPVFHKPQVPRFLPASNVPPFGSFFGSFSVGDEAQPVNMSAISTGGGNTTVLQRWVQVMTTTWLCMYFNDYVDHPQHPYYPHKYELAPGHPDNRYGVWPAVLSATIGDGEGPGLIEVWRAIEYNKQQIEVKKKSLPEGTGPAGFTPAAWSEYCDNARGALPVSFLMRLAHQLNGLGSAWLRNDKHPPVSLSQAQFYDLYIDPYQAQLRSIASTFEGEDVMTDIQSIISAFFKMPWGVPPPHKRSIY